MNQEKTQEETYSTRWEVAAWHYKVESNPPGINPCNNSDRAPWLADLTSRVLSALGEFAQVDSIDVSTDAYGEDSFNIQPDTAEDRRKLDAFLRATTDVSDIDIWLGLKCVQLNEKNLQEEFSIHNNSSVAIVNNLGKYGSHSLGAGLVRVSFLLGTDIYSPLARGDNRTLAALNGPRLRKFLHRLGDIPSLIFSDIDYSFPSVRELKEYGMLDRYGFKMPDDSRTFVELLRSQRIAG